MIFIRGGPSKYGYPRIHEPLDRDLKQVKEKFSEFFVYLKTVLCTKYVYFCTFHTTFCCGTYISFVGYWGGPYLNAVFPTFSSGVVLLSLSIGQIVGSIILPLISNLLNTRKWALVGMSLISFLISLSFVFFDHFFSFVVLYVMLLLWGIVTGATPSVCFAFVKELHDPTVSVAAMGLANTYTFIGSALFQELTGLILKSQKDNYRNALWIPFSVFCLISALGPILCPDLKPRNVKEKSSSELHDVNEALLCK